MRGKGGDIPSKMLRSTGQLQGGRRILFPPGQPASHFLGVVQLVGDVVGAGPGVLGVGCIDEVKGCGVIAWEGREGGCHFWWQLLVSERVSGELLCLVKWR